MSTTTSSLVELHTSKFVFVYSQTCCDELLSYAQRNSSFFRWLQIQDTDN